MVPGFRLGYYNFPCFAAHIYHYTIVVVCSNACIDVQKGQEIIGVQGV